MAMKPSYPDNTKPPELPKLGDSNLLDFFTHESIQISGPTPMYGDHARLEELGRQALELAVTETLFKLKDPMLDVSDIVEHRNTIMSDETLASWADMYSLRRKVRCLPQVAMSLDTPKENRKLFTAYVGALFWQDGPRVIQPWIQRLILPNGSEEVRGYIVKSESSAGKRIKTESEHLQMLSEKSRNSVSPSRSLTAQSDRSLSVVPEPPGPGATSTPLLHNQPQSLVVPSGDIPSPKITVSPLRPVIPPNPMPMAQSNELFLPHFNKMAQQRDIILNYESSRNSSIDQGEGAAWTAVCNVGGIPKGTGHGPTKQDAREAAARQAFYSLGWAPPAVDKF